MGLSDQSYQNTVEGLNPTDMDHHGPVPRDESRSGRHENSQALSVYLYGGADLGVNEG